MDMHYAPRIVRGDPLKCRGHGNYIQSFQKNTEIVVVLCFPLCKFNSSECLPLKKSLIQVLRALLIYTAIKTSSQNTRWKDKASQTVRNVTHAFRYNLYKQIATGFFFYSEINLKGGITGKKCITNPCPPLLYAPWNNISQRAAVELC